MRLTVGTRSTEHAIAMQGNGVRISFTRDDWPEGTVATFSVDLSFDNRQTWQPWIGPCRLSGGVALDRAGNEATRSSKSATWPGENAGSGPMSRREKRAGDVRLTLNAVQEFDSTIAVQSL